MEQIKKNLFQKDIKDFTFEVSNPLTHFLILSYKGPNIYDVHMDMGWGGLEICHVFTDSIFFKQQIYYSFFGPPAAVGRDL